MLEPTLGAARPFDESLELDPLEVSGKILGKFAIFIKVRFGIPKLGKLFIFNILGNCTKGKPKGFIFVAFNLDCIGFSLVWSRCNK